MNLPDVQRGMAILAEHIQRLNAAIRQTRLQPGIGYLLKESSGGTSLVIQTGPNSSNGGGGSGSLCYFTVTDASEGTTLKVEVQQDQISGRYPNGMGLGFPAFKLTISGNCYIYAKILFNTTTLQIDAGSEAITILQSNELQENTASEQYILLATVLTKTGPARIDKITNICAQPTPNACALAWTD